MSTSTLRLAVGPNPAAGHARATVSLDAPAAVRVEVVDLQGRTVRVLADGTLPAGDTALPFDTAGLAAGLYLVRLRTPRDARTVSLTVVR